MRLIKSFNMLKKASYLLVALLVLVSCKKETQSKHESIETEEISFTKNGELTFFDSEKNELKSIDLETAITDYEQQIGLMYRESMEENQGMLFIYEDEKPRPYFYMKNTYIGLDLIYLNANKKVVDINANAKPKDETTLDSDKPAKYVLEINSGMAEKWGVEVGSYVDFSIDK